MTEGGGDTHRRSGNPFFRVSRNVFIPVQSVGLSDTVRDEKNAERVEARDSVVNDIPEWLIEEGVSRLEKGRY
jgi:hypothetical protein